MIPQSLRSFVTRLRHETDVGTVQWLGGSENAYFCNHRKFTIHLSYSFDDDREVSLYRMSISANSKEAGFVVTSDEADIHDMRDLYASASVSAAGFQNIEEDFFEE
jgi:hypothetical protein